MRTSFWVALLLLLGSNAAHAELRFTSPAVDLGKLRGGPAYQQRFDFVNDSTQPIEILDIRLGCGCLQPVLDRRSYKPGERGSLLMHIRTLGQQAGSRTWQAHVQYREGDALHETRLVVGATLNNEITVEPSILAMLVETTLRQEVTITDHRAVPMKIIEVAASSAAIRVSIHSAGAGVTKVVLEVNGAALTTNKQEALLNIHTDDPHYRVLQVPITLNKRPRALVSATPDHVDQMGSGTRLVRLRSASDQAIRIDRVEAADPAIQCTWAAGPGQDSTIKIRILDARPIRTEVRVHLTEPAMVLTIPVEVR